MLPTLYQQFIHTSRYARWDDSNSRRETWPETVDRYLEFMCDQKCEGKIPPEIRAKLRSAILNLQVMPSMRCLMTAGPALDKDNAACYNCAATSVDTPEAFDEAMYLLMCGSGVGFSVERQFIANLPTIAASVRKSKTVIKVEDSKIGWANAFRELMSLLYQGRIPEWDTSLVRPAGAKLKTFGGRASGPAPLENLFKFTVAIFKNAEGRKLTSIECHDIMCKVGEIVVSGGVRRSAMISLSNVSDDRMRQAKVGQWYETAPWRRMANNSACYTDKPDMGVWWDEWGALFKSKSGERGVINRSAMKTHINKLGRRNPDHEFLTNPCGEIVLRPNQQCNLSEVMVRAEDNVETLMSKITLAVIMGTMQAKLTNFRYLRPIWKENADAEALLGVSLTGIMDNTLMSGREGKIKLNTALAELRAHAVAENKIWAKIIGVNQSTAVTCVKPSGTTSQLTNTASGIHPRFSSLYIRTVRGNLSEPVTKLMIDSGVPWEPDVMAPDTTVVFSFPFRAPRGCVTVNDVGPIEQLELWKSYHEYWCEHQVSITVYVKDPQWMKVGAWVYDHFDEISGVSFLPRSDHSYAQAPYQDATEKDILALEAKMPALIDWGLLSKYEKDDSFVTATRELACAGGSCELVDIG